jgi:glutamate 5-kinase
MLWLAHATSGLGQIHLDAGAVRAVRDRGASLLPAGITHVVGGFVARDPVDLVGPDGQVVARGLVAYDAAELPALLGRSTRDLAAELGPEYEREVVHRDDLVLLH